MKEDNPSNRKASATPDEAKITTRQAQRISKLAGIEAEDVHGLTIADAAERLKWRIDPGLFLFRRICGRVVKTDPVTGIDQPVPFATVHVEDTDCNFLGFFPVESPFWWFYPIFCHREEIGTTQTDACGNFCVWIPRFDIDWFLRFRLEHHCYIDLFRKPTLRDILEKFHAEEVEHQRIVHVNPNPPDPSPVEMLKDARTIRRIEDVLGHEVAMTLVRNNAEISLGRQTNNLTTKLDSLAYKQPIPPPRSPKLREILRKEGYKGVTHNLGISGARAERFSSLDFQKAYGPFWRCEDDIKLEWVPFFDVPDITFRVTQDIDGDGTEETIYSEGFFDVRWNAGAIPDVTLHANSLAISTPSCDPPVDLGPCATPGLVLVGHMPLINPTGAGVFPYLDTNNGYAVRPNRPHDTGKVDQIAASNVDASAPLAYLLEFYGCNHKTSTGAHTHFYKVLRETSLDEGANWSSPVPVIDTWLLFRSVGNPPTLEYRTITADANGWYPVVNPGEGWMPSDSLILQWHPSVTPNGFHRLSLELGDAGKNHLETTAAVPLRVDNTGIQASFYKLEWRTLPNGAWQDLGFNCPVIRRQGHDIELRITVHVTANHLRSVYIYGNGCGDGNAPVLVTGFEPYESGVPVGTQTNGYWHKSRNDNNFSNDAHPVVYRIDAGFSNGAYSFSMAAHSRAFYPGDGHLFFPDQSDTDYNPVWYAAYPYVAIAIVD